MRSSPGAPVQIGVPNPIQRTDRWDPVDLAALGASGTTPAWFGTYTRLGHHHKQKQVAVPIWHGNFLLCKWFLVAWVSRYIHKGETGPIGQ